METLRNEQLGSQEIKSFFWLRIFSTIIDLSIISSISILIQAILIHFLYVAFNSIWMAVLLLYYTSCYQTLNGVTIGRLLTGLQLVCKDLQPLNIKKLVLRELILKGLFLFIIPSFISEYCFSKQSVFFYVLVYSLVFIFSILFLLLLRKPWWEMVSNTLTIKNYSENKIPVFNLFMTYTALILISTMVIVVPFISNKNLLFNQYRPAYPKTSETKSYGEYVKQHAKDPVDYVFDLFEKYDIVVISERMHPEYTQYELYSKIVEDPRFKERVGNIFSETGSVSFQDTLNSLLQTKYESEDSLNKYTAILQRNSNGVWPLWDNTNMFDMLKRVNRLNTSLTDTSQQLHWYFTDLPVDWGKMTKETQLAAYTDKRRDSLEASVVINVHNQVISKQPRKKSLVIMNTRHGYGHIDKRFPQSIQDEFHGTTAFLQEALPGKVANILIHSITQKYAYMFTPTQNGKWDRVFEDIGNPDGGFDFSGSPFGEDQFDLAFIYTKGMLFKDVFTGYIFYKPLTAHFKKEGFPYEFKNFEDTMIRRASILSEEYIVNIKKQIDYCKKHPNDSVSSDSVKYALLYNVYQIVWGATKLLLSYLIAIFFYRKNRKMIL